MKHKTQDIRTMNNTRDTNIIIKRIQNTGHKAQITEKTKNLQHKTQDTMHNASNIQHK